MAINTKQRPGEAIFRHSVAARAPLFAVLDGARAPDGPSQAERAKVRVESLLAGDWGTRLREVAPFLVEFRPQSTFADWWFENSGESFGILVDAPVSMEQLRAHFRTLMIVRHEGRRHFFRFYDPRVLRVFLPTCTDTESKRFFGPIQTIHCEGEDARTLVTFKPGSSCALMTESTLPTDTEKNAGRRGR